MKKLDYFKLAITNNKFSTKNWVISAFSMTQSTPNEVLDYLDIVYNQTGYYYVDQVRKLIKIDDAAINFPLYRFLDRITIDNIWVPNAYAEPIETSYGNVIFNSVVMLNSFGTKIDFVLGQVSIIKIEREIAKRLIDDDDDETITHKHIKVSEYIKFVDSLQFILGLAQLSVVTATIKNIQMAPGLGEFKKQLLEKYNGKLRDPLEYVKFENELKAYDDEYLKNDPSTKSFMTGRVKDVSRKKMYLTIGTGLGFDENDNPTPILNSLHEGWPNKDPEQYTALMNNLRYGSFSRGNETMKGGVAAKILLRSAGNYKIKTEDCGTILGISRTYKESDISNLIDRYIIINSTSTLIDSMETAKQFINKQLEVRSPMYCKMPGEELCQKCAGKRLSENANGLALSLTEMASIILNTSMKAMHGKVLSSQEIDIKEVFS